MGMAVAVKDRETEMWCRAEVVDTQEVETTVRYVDYGYLVAIRNSEFLREIGALITLFTHLDRSMHIHRFPFAFLATVRGFTHHNSSILVSTTIFALCSLYTASFAHTFSSLYDLLLSSIYLSGLLCI